MVGDLVQLTTAFTGIQLIVIVFVLMELRALKEARKRDENLNDARDKSIALLNSRVAHIAGRLDIQDDGK